MNIKFNNYKGWLITVVKKGEIYHITARKKFSYLYVESKVLEISKLKNKIDEWNLIRKGYYPKSYWRW